MRFKIHPEFSVNYQRSETQDKWWQRGVCGVCGGSTATDSTTQATRDTLCLLRSNFHSKALEGEKPLTSWGHGNKAIKMEPHRTHMGPIFEEKQRLPQRLEWGRSHTWVSARKQLAKVVRLQKSSWVCPAGRAGSHLSSLSCSLLSTD